MKKQLYDGKKEFIDILHKEFKSQISLKELEENSLKLWAAYCLSIEKIDIDVSKWAVESYIEDYIFLKDAILSEQKGYKYKFEIHKDKNIFRGDTMTSFGNYIRRYFILKNKLKNIGKNSCAKNILNTHLGIEIYNEKFKKLYNEIVEFAYLTHTKGNLIPVPLNFNVERSGNFADCDYWDITMFEIFKWCETSDEKYIIRLLNRYNKNNNFEKSIIYFKDWMAIFNNNWKEFVCKNHLKSFVDLESENWYPIEFWENHFKDNRKISSLSVEELRKSLEIINNCVMKRNEEINRKY